MATKHLRRSDRSNGLHSRNKSPDFSDEGVQKTVDRYTLMLVLAFLFYPLGRQS
jgi:hypothetical protein